MRRGSRLGGTVAGMVLGACSLFASVDDLEGEPRRPDGGSGSGGSSSCSASAGCLGCSSCTAYCECTKPFAVTACVTECEDGGAGSAGSAGTAGSGGSAGSAGSATSDGSAGSGGGSCDDDKYVGQTCNATDTSSSCGSCLAMNCCTEITACFVNETCAQAYACWESACAKPDPTCALRNCNPCVGSAVSLLSDFAICASDACSAECEVDAG